MVDLYLFSVFPHLSHSFFRKFRSFFRSPNCHRPLYILHCLDKKLTESATEVVEQEQLKERKSYVQSATSLHR